MTFQTGSKTHLIVGRYSVSLTDQGQVRMVEVELGDVPNCLTYNKKKVKKNLSSKKLAKLFKGCKPETMQFGGNSIECEGISIETGGWGGKQNTPRLKILAE